MRAERQDLEMRDVFLFAHQRSLFVEEVLEFVVSFASLSSIVYD